MSLLLDKILPDNSPGISNIRSPVKSQLPASYTSLPVDVVSRIQSFCSQDTTTPSLSIVCKDWQRYLHWSQRPIGVQKRIDLSFESVAADTTSKWGVFNGMKKYNIHGIDDHALAKTLIQQLPVTQQSIAFLDVGAGNFEWGASLAQFLNDQLDIRQDLQIHIVSLRGEKYLRQAMQKSGRCILHNLGSFKIEELTKELKKRKLSLENNVIMGVSHYCMVHLADPVGTFAQIFDLLQPQLGLFLCDGFHYLLKEDTWKSYNKYGQVRANLYLYKLLHKSEIPFLMLNYSNNASLNQVILRRSDQRPCQLSLKYFGWTYRGNYSGELGSHVAVQFESVENYQRNPNINKTIAVDGDTTSLHGNSSKPLFVWLKKNGLLNKSATWIDVDPDTRETSSPLHCAVIEGNLEEIQKILKENASINEKNARGCTPLHLAIQYQRLPIARWLLEQGALPSCTNSNGRTPLHDALETDHPADYVNLLLTHRANQNIVDKFGDTPLDLAIKLRETMSEEILRKYATTETI